MLQKPPGGNAVTIFAHTPELNTSAIEVVVTVPTFRRPEHLIRTLKSLSAQATKRKFAVIVMENDAEKKAGAMAAAPLIENGQPAGLVILAHQRGNCHAYNAGWETALEQFPAFRYLLVIDDDEIADQDWMERLCATSEQYGCELVGGPQRPVFGHSANLKWQKHPVFRPHYVQTGTVAALYSSGNLLIGRTVLERMERPYLDLQFNFMGGGDSDFLSRARVAGYRQAWCNEAPVFETVPAQRLKWTWIQARGLRNGVISALVEKKKRTGQSFGTMKRLAKSFALLARSPFQAFWSAFRSGSLLIGLYPVHVGLGRLLAEFGYVNEQYRQPDKN